MGEQPPFRLTVKHVCADCNNGWMSELEAIAQRVLTPLMLGKPGTIEDRDQAAIAAWVQKTALIAMLLSSDEQRANGYGFAPPTYAELYEMRDRMEPLAATQTWIGRYQGARDWAVQVTPVCVRIAGIPEPAVPQGYISTITLGEVVLQDLRFVSPALHLEMTSVLGMAQLWPSSSAVEWPVGEPCDEATYKGYADGEALKSTLEHLRIEPWTQAAQLEQSTIANGTVALPAPCGLHSIGYPTALLRAARRGTRFAFTAACECGTAYLVYLESDRARFRAAGESQGVTQMYEDLEGDELLHDDEIGSFICKRIPALS